MDKSCKRLFNVWFKQWIARIVLATGLIWSISLYRSISSGSAIVERDLRWDFEVQI